MVNVPGVNELAVQLTVLAAGIGAAGFLLRGLWRFVRRVLYFGRRLGRQLDAMQDMLARELDPETGGSLKDDVTAIAQQMGMAQRRLGLLEGRLSRALRLAAEHHPESATEYLRGDHE